MQGLLKPERKLAPGTITYKVYAENGKKWMKPVWVSHDPHLLAPPRH